eukprot:scaffold375_cov189-Skeletonema_marinoi.AAC.12
MVNTRGSSSKKRKGSPAKSKTSSVHLRGSKFATVAKKAAKQISEVETKTKQHNSKIDEVEQRRKEAVARLDEMHSRLRNGRVPQLKKVCGEEAGLVEVEGELKLKVLPQFERAFDELGMGKAGGSYNTKELRSNKSALLPTDDAASRGMVLTGSKRNPNQIARSESDARRNSSQGGLWGWEKTSKNLSIIAKAEYARHKENGTGLADRNAKMSHNHKHNIPEMAEKYEDIIRIMKEGKGFEIHPPGAEVGIQNSIPYEKMLEYVAHYLRYKTFRDLQKNITNDVNEMGGMKCERFIGEEVLKYNGPFHPDQPRYKSAAYRFKFKQGNETRFETR